MTTEQTKTINSTYDSVNLINQLKTKEVLTEEDNACLIRNVEHLKIMMQRETFVVILSSEQIIEINLLIV